MKTIFVIEQGCYSDYHVVGVYSTRENAEKVLARISKKWDEPVIAEWALDPGIVELNAGLRQYAVAMRKDGTVEACSRSSDDFVPESHTCEPRLAMPYGAHELRLYHTVWAKDDKHAVKIVNELRMQLLATDQWRQS